MHRSYFSQTHECFRAFLSILLLAVGFLSGCSTSPPVVTEIAPAGDANDVGIESSVTARFSKAMDAGTINSVSFTLTQSSEPVEGAVTYDADTSTAKFTPAASLAYGTAYTAMVTTDASDKDGHALVRDKTWLFTTELLLDTTQPSILNVIPNDYATGTAITTTVRARFSEAMAAATINETSFTLTDQTGTPVSGTVAYDDSSYTATFTPGTNLSHDTTYMAKVTVAAADLLGNPLGAEKIWNFITGPLPDTTSPAQVVLLTVNVDSGRVDINWSDPTDIDFDHVVVAWTPDGTAGQVVAAGSESYSATGLVNNTEYTFTLVSVDTSDNPSSPASFTAKPTFSGEVTYDSLYSPTDLDALRSGLDGHYILMANIDLSVQFGTGWSPIGTNANPFVGSLDGNNHVITGLFVNNGSNYSGLFGYTGIGSIIKNIGVEDCDVTSGGWYTGGLVGYNNRGTIINCHSTGIVVSGAATIFTGGLIGLNSQGTMTSCYSTARVSGNYRVGGLAGHNNNANVSKCYATGNVVGLQTDVGGLFGYSNSNTISNCFATGAVTGTTNVGGFSGNFDYVTLNNCYSAGTVSGSSNVGGLVGTFSDTTFSHCYYDEDISGQNDTGKGEPRTTEQMKLIDTSVPVFENWDFLSIWDYENGYPYLQSNPLP
jgi:hypothetical protein